MLVLSRKVGEEIVIGGNIRVVINRVAGDRVTLAFKAPDDVRILRAELSPNEDFEPKAKKPVPRDVVAGPATKPSAAMAAAIAEPVAPKLPSGPRFKTNGRLGLIPRRPR